MRFNFINDGIRGCIYAIPAPQPEPRRVPCGGFVVSFNGLGYVSLADIPYQCIRDEFGGYDAVTNTKWRLDFDTREWVEVLDES